MEKSVGCTHEYLAKLLLPLRERHAELGKIRGNIGFQRLFEEMVVDNLRKAPTKQERDHTKEKFDELLRSPLTKAQRRKAYEITFPDQKVVK